MSNRFFRVTAILALILCLAVSGTALASSAREGTDFAVSAAAILEGSADSIASDERSRAALPVLLMLDATSDSKMGTDVASEVLYQMQYHDAYVASDGSALVLMLPMETGGMAVYYRVGQSTANYSIFGISVSQMNSALRDLGYRSYLIDRTLYRTLLQTLMNSGN